MYINLVLTSGEWAPVFCSPCKFSGVFARREGSWWWTTRASRSRVYCMQCLHKLTQDGEICVSTSLKFSFFTGHSLIGETFSRFICGWYIHMSVHGCCRMYHIEQTTDWSSIQGEKDSRKDICKNFLTWQCKMCTFCQWNFPLRHFPWRHQFGWIVYTCFKNCQKLIYKVDFFL